MAHIEDRIATDSKEHWILFTLNEYTDNTPGAVTAQALYDATSKYFPTASWVEDCLDELARRYLVEHTESGYTMHPNGRTALKHTRKPENALWKQDITSLSDNQASPDVLETDTWVNINSPRIYFASEADTIKGLHVGRKPAEYVRERLPDDFSVVITVTPYRNHDVAYKLYADDRVVQIDVYSARAGCERMYAEDIASAVESDWLRVKPMADAVASTVDSECVTWVEAHEV